MKIARLFMVLAICCSLTQATSIVLVEYPGGLIVGADSLRVYPNGKHVEYTHECKLRTVPGVILATHGAGWERAYTTFKGTKTAAPDLRIISDKILQDTKTKGAKLKSQRLSQELMNGNAGFWTALASRPDTRVGWVFVDSTGAYEVEITVSPDHKKKVIGPQLQENTIALADNRLTAPYLVEAKKRGITTRSEAIQVVENALERANQGDPHGVAPPYAILDSSPFGMQWIDHSGCPSSKIP